MLRPCLRHTSTVGSPASCSLIIPIICASVKRLFLICLLLPRGQTLHQIEGTFGGQVKPRKLAKPDGLVLDDLAIGRFHARRADFQEAFLLEKVEMPQALDLCVVDGMQARYPSGRKPRSGDKVDTDRQGLGGRVEIDAA